METERTDNLFKEFCFREEQRHAAKLVGGKGLRRGFLFVLKKGDIIECLNNKNDRVKRGSLMKLVGGYCRSKALSRQEQRSGLGARWASARTHTAHPQQRAGAGGQNYAGGLVVGR